MVEAPSDHPAWAAARAAQADLGRDLLLACGAHGLDIAWVDGPQGRRVPGLVLHVDTLDDHGAPMDVVVGGRRVSVPGTLSFEVDGTTHTVPLRVVQSPATTFEHESDH